MAVKQSKDKLQLFREFLMYVGQLKIQPPSYNSRHTRDNMIYINVNLILRLIELCIILSGTNRIARYNHNAFYLRAV
jgi:hypothetical protein